MLNWLGADRSIPLFGVCGCVVGAEGGSTFSACVWLSTALLPIADSADRAGRIRRRPVGTRLCPDVFAVCLGGHPPPPPDSPTASAPMALPLMQPQSCLQVFSDLLGTEGAQQLLVNRWTLERVDLPPGQVPLGMVVVGSLCLRLP